MALRFRIRSKVENFNTVYYVQQRKFFIWCVPLEYALLGSENVYCKPRYIFYNTYKAAAMALAVSLNTYKVRREIIRYRRYVYGVCSRKMLARLLLKFKTHN